MEAWLQSERGRATRGGGGAMGSKGSKPAAAAPAAGAGADAAPPEAGARSATLETCDSFAETLHTSPPCRGTGG